MLVSILVDIGVSFYSLKRLPSHVSAKDKSAIFRALPVYRILDPEVKKLVKNRVWLFSLTRRSMKSNKWISWLAVLRVFNRMCIEIIQPWFILMPFFLQCFWNGNLGKCWFLLYIKEISLFAYLLLLFFTVFNVSGALIREYGNGILRLK